MSPTEPAAEPPAPPASSTPLAPALASAMAVEANQVSLPELAAAMA
jgi:hypothetical protein